MKRIEFETSKGRFFVVDAINNANIHTGIKLSEITEEQASEIVEEFKYHPTLTKKVFIDYLNEDFYIESAIESLHSLLESKGIHLFKNPHADKIGITDFDYHRNKSEQKTFYNPYIFKL